MPLVEVRTSIRLADSLERGVSLFMAELERLKQIVDAARAPDREHPLLYLLDEILHGTNTAERLIAARAVFEPSRASRRDRRGDDARSHPRCRRRTRRGE